MSAKPGDVESDRMRPTKEIKRLARFAETSFASLCAKEGALCNESQEDENGWDYLVEFPSASWPGSADTQPPSHRAFVQVKSTRNRRLSCSIKLSNALKAAQSRDPWFIVLIIATEGGPKLYAVHVWEQLIEKMLRAVRQASIDKVPLHKRRMAVDFETSDLRADDVVGWMSAVIGAVKPDYPDAKKRIYETIGYANGVAGSGKLTFAANNINEIFDEFLGMGKGLPVSRFTYTPTRFGISDSRPLIDVAEGRVEITPTAAGECELRMRGSNGSAMSLPAKLYVLGMPWLPPSDQRFRVAATGFEIVWMNDGDSSFTANLDFASRSDLDTIGRFATTIIWLCQGPIDVQVWAKGGRLVGGVLNADSRQHHGYDWQKVLDIVETLKSLPANASAPWLQLSVVDIDKGAHDVYLMHQVVSAPSFRFEFMPLSDTPEVFTTLLYYSTADVGQLTAFALIERRVLASATLDDGRRRVDLDKAIVRESWIVHDASDAQRLMMREDYDHHLGKMSEVDSVMDLADIALLVRSTKSQGTE
jgi:hypothetical protein